MISGFEQYTLNAWADERGLLVRVKQHIGAASYGAIRRNGMWNTAIGSMVMSALLMSVASNAMAIPTLNVGGGALSDAKAVRQALAPSSPSRGIDQTFNSFFDHVRSGKMLIPSDRIRMLAQVALQSQKEEVDIETWARTLADDVKAAHD